MPTMASQIRQAPWDLPAEHSTSLHALISHACVQTSSYAWGPRAHKKECTTWTWRASILSHQKVYEKKMSENSKTLTAHILYTNFRRNLTLETCSLQSRGLKVQERRKTTQKIDPVQILAKHVAHSNCSSDGHAKCAERGTSAWCACAREMHLHDSETWCVRCVER